MALFSGVPTWLLVLAVASAIGAVGYFLFVELRRDHDTGEYNFTWGVGVVVLFLLGFAPGLVGLGLYLTVERDYPLHWLLALVGAALAVVTAASLGVEVTASGAEATLAIPAATL